MILIPLVKFLFYPVLERCSGPKREAVAGVFQEESKVLPPQGTSALAAQMRIRHADKVEQFGRISQ